MVRSIRRCSTCRGRFVANASQVSCGSCRCIGEDSSNSNKGKSLETNHQSPLFKKEDMQYGCETTDSLINTCTTRITTSATNAANHGRSFQMEDHEGFRSTNKRAKLVHATPPESSTTIQQKEKQHSLDPSKSSLSSSTLSLLSSISTPSAVIDLCEENDDSTRNDQLERDDPLYVTDGLDTQKEQQQDQQLQLQQQQDNQPRGTTFDNDDNDTDDSQSEQCSEAGDDFNCTQIEQCEENDEAEEGMDDENGHKDFLDEQESKQKQQRFSMKNQETPTAARNVHDRQEMALASGALEKDLVAASDKKFQMNTEHNGCDVDDICFICGTSLKNLKRRVDHIKRCSKKHGISARDVAVNDDHEAFSHEIETTTTTTADKENTTKNPYAKDNQWHGDSSLALRLAGQDGSSSNDNELPSNSSKKQTTLQSFFEAPKRNLHAVLVSGARRMSKMAKVVSAQKEATGASNNKAASTTQGRFGRGGGRSFQTKRRGACPLYKKIPGTDFVCDGFMYANCSLTKNYFLTHFHSDHYGGIASSWSTGTIYCSVATAALVNQQLRVDKKYIHPLPLNVPTVIESREKPITVTLLDANHCPGAVMFLFQVGKRHILHVGDFRWNRNVMLQNETLKAFASGKLQLDELFLDTTYCDAKYTLPTQEEAIHEAVAMVRKEIRSSKENRCRTLHIFGAYTIGKERIYLAVAEQLGLKVYVDRNRFRILSALQWPKERMALLTTRKEDTCLWVVPLGHINMKKMPEYLNNKLSYNRIVGYRPTGWSMKPSPNGGLISSRSSGNLSIHSIPYSEHSAFNELLDCLACLRPQKIVPTVNASKSREQVDLLLTALRQKQTMLPFATKPTRTVC